MTVKPIKFGNSVLRSLFFGNGVEWNGVVKLTVFLGLIKILWAIIQRYIIRVEIVPIATVLGMQALNQLVFRPTMLGTE